MKVLILGCTRFVGRDVTRLLLLTISRINPG
jgi:hypothetical protein